MMRLSKAVGSLVVGLVVAFAPATPGLAAPGSTSSLSTQASSSWSDSPVNSADQATLNRVLDARFLATVDAARQRLNLISDYQCSSTPLTTWFTKRSAALSAKDRQFLADTGADTIAALDAELLGTASTSGYAVTLHRAAIIGTFGKLRGFWTPQTKPLALLGMHSSTVLNSTRVARVARVAWGFSAAEAATYAKYVVSYTSKSKGLQYGRSPLLSAGAFTVTPKISPGISSRIVVGDGILQAYDALGFSATAPQYITAHEFAHSVQSAAGLFNTPVNSPERSRYLELMADAEASYFVSQPSKGLAFSSAKMQQVIAASYDAGDCSFAATDHHGTPMQRKRSASWAYAWQLSLRPRTTVVSFAMAKRAFDRAYQTRILPDS